MQLQNLRTDLTIAGESYQKNKVSDSNSLQLCSKNNITDPIKVQIWQALLDIPHWNILCEPIDEMQVMDDLNGDFPGHEFVGIAIDFVNRSGIIYHTRTLQDDDIVHELLHVRFPEWSEQTVNYWTDLIVEESEVNILKLNRERCKLAS